MDDESSVGMPATKPIWAHARSLIRAHPVAAYCALAYAFSWLVAAPLIASAHGFPVRVPPAIHYLGAYGPLLAAVIVTALVDGTAGLRDLLAHVRLWRVGVRWLLIGVGSPALLFALAAVAARLLHGAWPDIRQLGRVNYLPDLGFGALPLWVLTFGFGEEIGWRGFALPRLQRRHGALAATLILGGVWALWHLPGFFYNPTWADAGSPPSRASRSAS